MVGPLSDAERRSGLFRLKVTVTIIVGVSAGLMTLQGDAAVPVIAGAVAVGLVAGGVLAWYVFPGNHDTSADRRQ